MPCTPATTRTDARLRALVPAMPALSYGRQAPRPAVAPDRNAAIKQFARRILQHGDRPNAVAACITRMGPYTSGTLHGTLPAGQESPGMERMGQERTEGQRGRDRRSPPHADLPSPDEVANHVAGAPVARPAPAKKPHPIRQHNAWLAQLPIRQRVVHIALTLGALAGVVISLLLGGGLGVAAAVAFGLAFLLCCVTFSPWNQRVRR
jgi:hypothetical protein